MFQVPFWRASTRGTDRARNTHHVMTWAICLTHSRGAATSPAEVAHNEARKGPHMGPQIGPLMPYLSPLIHISRNSTFVLSKRDHVKCVHKNDTTTCFWAPICTPRGTRTRPPPGGYVVHYMPSMPTYGMHTMTRTDHHLDQRMTRSGPEWVHETNYYLLTIMSRQSVPFRHELDVL